MKKRFGSLILAGAIVLLGAASGACELMKVSPTLEWDEAGKMYQEKDYEGAIEMYEKMLSKKSRDPDIYYNLGDAYYKSKKLGLAILNYQKALRLDPRSKDIRANLKLADSQVPLQIEDSTPVVIKWFIKQSRYFRKGEVINLALIFYIGVLFFTILRFFKQRRWIYRGRRLFLTLLIASLVLLGFKLYDLRYKDAIVLTSKTEVRYGPSNHEKAAFHLAEGVAVKAVDQSGDWYRIDLPSGETGWVKKTNLGFIS